ncbi:GTP-binding protein [Candidatus Woesearchaeota archaeon]|nr:GTP-binding protein [Candidatus Woesearchaeota archaeon]
MNFQNLPNFEDSQHYLDIAFSASSKKVKEQRLKLRRFEPLQRAKREEVIRLDTVKRVLARQITKLLKSFPSIDSLPEFYQELIRLTLDYKQLKKSLAALNWFVQKVEGFHDRYIKLIFKTRDINKPKQLRAEFYGRVSSLIRQVGDDLKYLDNARKTLKGFPDIKDNLFTIAIAGFPNVGKSTLLSKLTTSNPDIDSYAFTTKRLLIGYRTHKYEKLQFVDTPGALNRHKMNFIENMAYLALKYVADVIVYIYDLSEPYPLKDQIKLYKNMKKFSRPVIVYVSKTDILDKKLVEQFKNDSGFKVFDNIDDLNNEILLKKKEY